MNKQTCGTCHYATFPRTPTGRIVRDSRVECTFDPVLPPMPLSIGEVRFAKRFVEAKEEGCPCWHA